MDSDEFEKRVRRLDSSLFVRLSCLHHVIIDQQNTQFLVY